MFSTRRIVLSSVAALALSLGNMGCQPERADVIPSSAQMMVSGDKMLHYMAPDDGKVYVYDHAANHLLWSGRVSKGQTVDVDPVKNQIMAGGSVVTQRNLAVGNQNDVYFEPSPMPVRDSSMDSQKQNNMNINNSNSTPGNYSGGLTVTPSVSVQPNNGQAPAGSVTVQPGLSVSPSTQPSRP